MYTLLRLTFHGVPIQWQHVRLSLMCTRLIINFMFISDRDDCRVTVRYTCQYLCNYTQGSYRCVCPSGMYAPETRKYRCYGELPLNIVYICDTYIYCAHTCALCRGNVHLGHNYIILYIQGVYISTHVHDYCLSQSTSLLTADSNECLDGNGGCSHQCINTFRSYKCTCPKGMILQANGTTCGPSTHLLCTFQSSTWLCMLSLMACSNKSNCI